MLAQQCNAVWEKTNQVAGWWGCEAHPGCSEMLWSDVCVTWDAETCTKSVLPGKEQGKCRLSSSKALGISPISCTAPSNTVDTQLALQPLDPSSVVWDKTDSLLHPGGWCTMDAAGWVPRRAAFCKNYILALFAHLSEFFCLLAACEKFEREEIVYLRKSQIF